MASGHQITNLSDPFERSKYTELTEAEPSTIPVWAIETSGNNYSFFRNKMYRTTRNIDSNMLGWSSFARYPSASPLTGLLGLPANQIEGANGAIEVVPEWQALSTIYRLSSFLRLRKWDVDGTGYYTWVLEMCSKNLGYLLTPIHEFLNGEQSRGHTMVSPTNVVPIATNNPMTYGWWLNIPYLTNYRAPSKYHLSGARVWPQRDYVRDTGRASGAV